MPSMTLRPELTPQQLQDWFFATFGSCGCGNPDSVALLLNRVLDIIEEGGWRSELEPLLPTDGLMFSYLGWLNHIGILEHGTAMPGWLTAEGEAVLAALEKHGVDVDAWSPRGER